MSEPKKKPTLHEIAAMPFPASQAVMREFYNPHWGMPTAGDGEKRAYKVRLHYSYSVEDEATFQVEAFSEEEAEELAIELLGQERSEDFDCFDVDINEAGQ